MLVGCSDFEPSNRTRSPHWRTRGAVSVIARSETTKQSPKQGDCFAPLAMTLRAWTLSLAQLNAHNPDEF